MYGIARSFSRFTLKFKIICIPFVKTVGQNCKQPLLIVDQFEQFSISILVFKYLSSFKYGNTTRKSLHLLHANENGCVDHADHVVLLQMMAWPVCIRPRRDSC